MAGGVHGGGHKWQGACIVGIMCGRGVCGRGQHAWHTHPRQILRVTVNERAVRILLEYILVSQLISIVSHGNFLISVTRNKEYLSNKLSST